MKRGFDAETAAPVRGDESPKAPAKLPCWKCGSLALHGALASYGGMCPNCYEGYCNSTPEVPHWAANKNVDGPKGWARALKKREMLGERLTPAQKAMWRSALRFEEGDE
jgi:hypothetical protein